MDGASTFRSVNPATGQSIGEYPGHDARAVQARLGLAGEIFPVWRRTSFAERAARLRRVAAQLREQRSFYARQMTEEMGKTIGAAEAEVDKCAWVCEYYAEQAPRLLAPEPVATDATSSHVAFEPLGPLLAVMPWNFPFWQVFRCAAPALAAGNVVLLKHASNVPGCALALEQIFRRGGFPEGVFQTLLVGSAQVAEIIAHPVVRAVTITGSEAAGRAVGAAAGRALKQCVLELGGSDPFIVLAGADPREAAAYAVQARCVNNGQSCIAAKRFIVEEPLAPVFEAELVARMKKLSVGDPLDHGTELGPLAREDLLAELDRQVQRSMKAGATLRAGGARLPRPGFFYAPTVLTGVQPGMAAFDEEVFGPVAAVTRARDEQEAVRLANSSRFGLGASIWIGDAGRGQALAQEIEAGMVFVNETVRSDPRLPFGGVKDSGHGRELAAFGIREFVNVKSVWVK